MNPTFLFCNLLHLAIPDHIIFKGTKVMLLASKNEKRDVPPRVVKHFTWNLQKIIPTKLARLEGQLIDYIVYFILQPGTELKSDFSNFGVVFLDIDSSRVTSKLRYYPKEYVQQFMAEAMPFVLRNAPDEQLKRGSHVIDYFVVAPPSLLSCFLYF